MSATNAAAATSSQQTAASAPQFRKGIVKQVLSGDTVVIRAAKGAPPPEKQITFSYVLAPKLARRPGAGGEETRDEAYAWESREFLRKKLIGEEVCFTFEKSPNFNREYGFVWLGKDQETGENVVESIVSEGLVSVRREGRPTPELQRLIELEDSAKQAARGKWSHTSPSDHVRHIKWTQENPVQIVELYKGKTVKAIIEHVRDGSTVRAFLLPEFHYITLMIAGIRCNGVKLDADGKPDLSVKVPFADEARYFVESRLLQREVEIRLESVNNANFIGTILYPKGNIAEALLREGLAKCVDWSIAVMKEGAEKLRAAERLAKEKRLRLWQDYQSKAPAFNSKEKDFTGVVVEVFNGDAINVKLPSGQIKKVFLSSIRPPRDTTRSIISADGEEVIKVAPPRGKSRPLYEIPMMFEAREFLRKKLINKKVQCNLDYISPVRDNFPEKYCYTVTIGGQNLAETMVGKGLATVVRYRQDDDQRSAHYDELLSAEAQAIKGLKGVHGRKENTPLRINDLTVDHSRIKQQYLPSWQRALRTEGIVEFVASGSRLRMYIPKDSCLVSFLLAGIACPRSSRFPLNGGVPSQDTDVIGDEALAFTRDRVLQRDVSVHIDTIDKAGTSVIGWLWTDTNTNLSLALVEEGLAKVHFSAAKSEYYRALKSAEDRAKDAKKNMWANYVDKVAEENPATDEDKEDKVSERKLNYENVVITEITPDLTFFAQPADAAAKLDNLMAKLRSEFQMNPPITGTYTPKRGDLCAAQFSADKEWYRAKVERVQGNTATVLYIDYGNKELVSMTRLASLPPAFTSERPHATEYALGLVSLPPDNEDKEEALRAFAQDVLNRKLQMNVELKPSTGLPLTTLHDPATNADIGKGLVSDGLLLVDKRGERKLKELVEQYKAAQDSARAAHLAIWKYGDITQDDAPEFSR